MVLNKKTGFITIFLLIVLVVPYTMRKSLLIDTIKKFPSGRETGAPAVFYFGSDNKNISVAELKSIYTASDSVLIIDEWPKHADYRAYIYNTEISQYSFFCVIDNLFIGGIDSVQYKEYYIWYGFGWYLIARELIGIA